MANLMAKGKATNLYAYLTIYQTMKYGDIPYFEQSTPRENQKEIMLPSSSNQERDVIKKDLFTKLSSEAKEVINIVLNSPNEILETFKTPKYGIISRNKIKKYLISNGWKTKFVEKVFSELKEFVMSFEEWDENNNSWSNILSNRPT